MHACLHACLHTHRFRKQTTASEEEAEVEQDAQDKGDEA